MTNVSQDAQWRFYLLATVGGIVAIASILSVYAALRNGFSAAVLGLSGSAVLAFLALPIMLRKGYMVFEPLTFVIVPIVFGVTLAIPYAFLGRQSHVRDFVLLGRSHEVLLSGMALIALGMVSAALGYMVRPRSVNLRRWKLVHATRWRRSRLGLLIGVCVGVWSVCTLLFVREMGIEATSLGALSSKRFLVIDGAEYRGALGYYRWGASLIQVAYYTLLTWLVATRRRLWSPWFGVLVALGLGALVLPFITSMRTEAMTVFINTLMIVYLLGRRINRRMVLGISGAAVVLFTALTVLRTGADDWDELRTAVGTEVFLEATIGRRAFLSVSATSHISESVPEVLEYQFGQTYLKWLVAPIPRRVWPDKPAIGSGPVLGPLIFDTPGSGVPPGAVAELYMNFGVVGVGVGMFLIGVFLRWCYTSVEPVLSSPNMALLYALAIVPFFMKVITTDFSRAMVGLITTMVPIIIGLYIVGSRPRPGSVAPNQ